MWTPLYCIGYTFLVKVFEIKNIISRESRGPRPGSGSVPVKGRRPSSVKELTGLALEVEKIYSASQKSTPKALPFTPYLIPNRSCDLSKSTLG